MQPCLNFVLGYQLHNQDGAQEECRAFMPEWKPHFYRIGSRLVEFEDVPTGPESHRKLIEPWLTALFQSEHLSLLLGSGFTTAISLAVGATATSMATKTFSLSLADNIDAHAREEAEALKRGEPNIEDQLRVATQLLSGLKILEDDRANPLEEEINLRLSEFLGSLLETEAGIASSDRLIAGEALLQSFLLSFASRSASRDRLNVFTTNYDRLIEFGCDLSGLRVIDRFVGTLYPVFRSSRISLDVHYNPPGIRGEPRYLEGVLRLTKLHGSIDWRWDAGSLRRTPLPFGTPKDKADLPAEPLSSVMIYPNPAKDVETLNFPYAELFRDFSAALCRPNSALVTYGYGFGDDHINRVLRDMLTIPSTHLVVIAYNDPGNRIRTFCDNSGREAQVTLLLGSHFGEMATLTEHYLPKPAIDLVSIRQAEILRRRTAAAGDSTPSGSEHDVPD